MAIERVSKAVGGPEGSQPATAAALSANSQIVAFQSRASELVGGDTNNSSDIFVFDRSTDRLALVSAGLAGEVGNRGSFAPSISSDGRLIAFESEATNLAVGDDNGVGDIYARDVASGFTLRISTALDGGDSDGSSANPAISADGSSIAFESVANNLTDDPADGILDVFLASADLATIKVSVGLGGEAADGNSGDATLSSLGRYLAFSSDATNLVAGDTNAKRDVFVFDRNTGEIERVSDGKGGLQANSGAFDPAISGDGRFVAFHSGASNLVKNDRNGLSDIFVVDQFRGKIVRASVGLKGVDADGESFSPSLSSDGRYVTFHSEASNLVAGDTNGTTDVFVYDTKTKRTLLMSDPPGLAPADAPSFSEGRSLISGNGSIVAFTSAASNLVADDTNAVADIFVSNVFFPSRRGAPRTRDGTDGEPLRLGDLVGDDRAGATGSSLASAPPSLSLDPGSLLTPTSE